MRLFTLPLILIFAFFIYLPSFFNPFIWDDEQFIYRNVFVQQAAVREIFTTNTVAGAGEVSNYYRPLTTLSFAIDYHLWNGSPLGFHLTNTLLHLLAGLMLFFVLRRLKIPELVAKIIVSIFLLHPLQTEAVTYINSRGDSLYTVFGLTSIWLLQRSLSDPIKYRLYNLHIVVSQWQLAGLSSLSYVASILSKEIGIAIGGILAVTLLWNWMQKTSTVKSIRTYATTHWMGIFSVALSGLLAIVYIILRATVLNFENSFNFYDDTNVYANNIVIRLLTFSKIIWIYLRLIVAPFPLHMERDTEIVGSWLSIWPWLGLALMTAVAILARREWQKKRTSYIALGTSWIIITLLPVSGIIPINGLLYEHWLYLPLVGWLIAVYGLLRLSPKKVKIIFTNHINTLLISVTIIFSILTLYQNYLWGDHVRFYTHVLKFSESARVHNNLAMAYADRAQWKNARTHYERAIEIAEAPPMHHNMGNLFLAEGEIAAAIDSFERAIALDRSFYHSYYTLFSLYIELDRLDEAKNLLRRAESNLISDPNIALMQQILDERLKSSSGQ